jgi:zinc/manganese transport system permease protein
VNDWWSVLFDFSDYGELLVLLHNSVIAGAVLGIVGGLVGVFVMTRDLAFAVHGISELSFAGAAAALLFGIGVVEGAVIGSIVAAAIIGLLGARARERNSITAVLMPFGLGLGILCLSLTPGRTSNKFGLLTGQIVAVDDPRLGTLAVVSAVVVIGLLVIWRPLAFAGADPEVAAARGVPVRGLSLGFMLLLGLAVAASVQIVDPGHSGGGRPADLLLPGRRPDPEHGVRRGFARGRHPSRPRGERSDQSVRDDDLLRHLRRLPARRSPS